VAVSSSLENFQLWLRMLLLCDDVVVIVFDRLDCAPGVPVERETNVPSDGMKRANRGRVTGMQAQICSFDQFFVSYLSGRFIQQKAALQQRQRARVGRTTKSGLAKQQRLASRNTFFIPVSFELGTSKANLPNSSSNDHRKPQAQQKNYNPSLECWHLNIHD
jgi:hypothetical protein